MILISPEGKERVRAEGILALSPRRTSFAVAKRVSSVDRAG